MKDLLIAVVFFAALGALAWRVFRPEAQQEEEEIVATEVPVHVGKLARVTLHRYVSAYGVVEPEPVGDGRPAAGARLAPAAPGLVGEVTCAEGQHVESGQVLVRLDTRQADVEIQRAREQLLFAQRHREREEKLLAVGGTSQRRLLEAQEAVTAADTELAAAQTRRALLEIRAPFAAVVTRIHARPGEGVDPSSVLAEIVDPDRLVIATHVPASDLAELESGQPVEVLPGSEPVAARGAVLYVSQQVDPRTGTALVRTSLPRDSGMRVGQYVNLRIVSEERPGCLAAPAASVVRTEEGETVIAKVEGDLAVRKRVEVGLHEGAWVEIRGEGLQAGDTVVTAGAWGLPEETRIRVLGK
jgi:membrane fusion protein (multidrug efflux system)